MNTTKISELPKFTNVSEIAEDDFIQIIDKSANSNKTATVGILSDKITALVTPEVESVAEAAAANITNDLTDTITSSLNDTIVKVNMMYPMLVFVDTNINAATTLVNATAYNKNYICSNTSTPSDYSITLPITANADIGKLIQFTMSSSLTRFVTLTANSGQNIDGSVTRVMWSRETVTLRSTGSGWTKVAGRSIPLMAKATSAIDNTTGQSIPHNAETVVDLIVTEFDNSTRMVDLTTDKMSIFRSGVYSLKGCVYWDGSGSWSAPRVTGRIRKNANSPIAFSENNAIVGSGVANIPSAHARLNTGDFVQLVAFQNSGVSRPVINFSHCLLSVVEIPDW